jgi:hypothetical protein
VYAHLDKENKHDTGTWVLDIRATNHMSGCQEAFTKLSMTVLGTAHFGDDSMVQN